MTQAPEFPQEPEAKNNATPGDFQKLRYAAEVEGVKQIRAALVQAELDQAKATADASSVTSKARLDAAIANRAAELATENTLQQSFHQNLFDVAKGSLERARASGELFRRQRRQSLRSTQAS